MINSQTSVRDLVVSVITVAMWAGFPAIASAQSSSLEEVIVTASKRETTLQEIPVAVSVVSGDSVEKAQILDLKDLQSVVPSLRINQLQNSANTNFIIRGFGNGANNPGIEPSVGVFIDGVYRSRSASQIADLPNLERVEVLRGPQSTLFGKNASAGVISIVTRTPSGEPGARVSVTGGNFGQLLLKGNVQGAISENVAFELSAGSNTRDGYIDNNVLGTEINERNRQSARAQLAFTPSDATSVRFIADWDTIDEDCCAVNNLFQSPLEVFVNAQTGAVVNPNSPFANDIFFNQDPANDIENMGASVQIDHDYENFALTSITAFRKVDSFSNIDADFSSADYITNPITTKIDTFTQELRLTSTAGEAVDWMIGGYFFDEAIDYRNSLNYGPGFRPFVDALTLAAGAANALAGIEGALMLPVGRAFFPASGAVTELGTLDNQAASVFGQVDWHINDRLTATLGLNYTQDEKDASLVQTQQDPFSSVDLVQLGLGFIFNSLTMAGVPPAIALAQATALSTTATNPFLALQAVQFLEPVQAYPNVVENGKTDDDKLTYTIRLAFDLSDNVNVYGGLATGFKATSVNLSRDAEPTPTDLRALQNAGLAVVNLDAGTRVAGPEEATVLEVGMKASFETVAVNLAIFDQKITGFQSNVFQGGGFNLINAEKQSTQGIEFDVTYYPIEDLMLTMAGTLLDPIYDKFTQSSAGDISGDVPAGIHKTSISFGAAYDWVTGNGLDAYVRGDFLYEDKVRTNDNVPPEFSSEDTKNLNLSAGITTQNGFSVSVWGRNVTDHETITTGFPTVGNTGGFFGYRNQPRTYGVTLSKDF